MLQALEWILLGAYGAAAIIYGVYRHRPTRVGPWLLMAGAIATLATGDVLLALGFPVPAEVCYCGMFMLVASGMLQFTRGGAILVDRARLIDLLAFTCATLLVVWVLVIGDSSRIGEVSAVDVIGDLLLIGVATRLRIAAGRNVSATLLLAGAIGTLGSDIAWALHEGWVSELGYVVLYLCWGAAALHPSMTRLTAPMPTQPSPWQGRWIALLGISVATPPVVLMIEAVSGEVNDGVVIAVAGALTLLLAITRLADSVAQHSRALTRERALREASEALVSAADEHGVDEAVRAAVAALLPAAAVQTVVFATDDRELTLLALPPAGAGPPRRLSGSATSTTDGGRRPTTRSAPFSHLSRSWWMEEQESDSAATLVCPLWLEPLAVARPSGGALVLTGRREALTAGQDALEVLAGQAALALDRITLVDAIGRRDSDLYLRAVIRNTADIMLVIDENQLIRYASPALFELLGVEELPPLAMLRDLVHPNDRIRVRQTLGDEGDGVLHCALQREDDTQVLVEVTYRDLRGDRLVQGYVLTMRNVTDGHQPGERLPSLENMDELPAWVNRRSAQHKFRY